VLGVESEARRCRNTSRISNLSNEAIGVQNHRETSIHDRSGYKQFDAVDIAPDDFLSPVVLYQRQGEHLLDAGEVSVLGE
jgi:hypothetical protein